MRLKRVEHGNSETEERFLQLENSVAQQNSALRKEIETLNQYNDHLAASMDQLMQDKLGANVYITNLLPQYQNKEGLVAFIHEHLKVEIDTHQIRTMYNITGKDEIITKIIFDNPDTKNLIYAQRCNLREINKVWMHEDLTKPRVHLAY